ncbi:MAG: Sec-independent protein translocase protein TatB [Pseudomonadota bacterium]
MLPSFGWTEMLMIAIVLIVVIGPKDAITMMRGASKQIKSFRRMAGDFQRQFNDALEEAELGEIKDVAKDLRELDPRKQVRDALKPLEDDLKYAGDELEAPAASRSKVDSALDDAGAKMREAQPTITPKAIVSLDNDAPPPEPKPAAGKKAPAKKPAAKARAAPKKPATKKPVAAKKPAAAKKATPIKRAPANKAKTTGAKTKKIAETTVSAPAGDDA